MRDRLRVLVTLYRCWRWGDRARWRSLLRALGEWPHHVFCPSCGGSGEPYHAGGCEWCGGERTWDLRESEDWDDGARAMVGLPSIGASQEPADG